MPLMPTGSCEEQGLNTNMPVSPSPWAPYMTLVTLDVETLGLNGPCRLVQYQVNDGPIQLVKLFKGKEHEHAKLLQPLFDLLLDPTTLALGFNIGFDLYHLYRIRGLPSPFLCGVLDLLIHAQLSGPFSQYAFIKKGGKGVKLSRIPRECVEYIAGRVEREIAPLLPVHGKLSRHLHEVKGFPHLATVSWEVKVSLGLKPHMAHLGEPVLELKKLWPIPPKKNKAGKPFESIHLPYADERYDFMEPEILSILENDSHEFFKYANDDIRFTRKLWEHLGRPQPNHHDACVACVAFTRYYGLPLDKKALKRAEEHFRKKIHDAEVALEGINLRSPKQRLELIKKYVPFAASSSKKVVEKLIKLPGTSAEAIRTFEALTSHGKFVQRLNQILKAGESKTGRLHVDLRVFGTATGRMAGAGGFNIQGIAKPDDDEGEVIGLRNAILAAMVGDFWSFEPCIAAAVWDEKQLAADLDQRLDLYIAIAQSSHPHWPKGVSYEEGLKNKTQEPFKTLRTKNKPLLLGIFYGMEAPKVADTLGISESEAVGVLERIFARYPRIKAIREAADRSVCTGDTEHWREDSVSKMATSTTDITGHSRHWRFEALLADKFWRLASKSFEGCPNGNVIRQSIKGRQTFKQAIRSALLGAALGLQKAVKRQYVNSDIQSPGANLCKMLMAKLWTEFHIPMIGVHDEAVAIDHPNLNQEAVKKSCHEFVQDYRRLVPHLEFDLKNTIRWSDK